MYKPGRAGLAALIGFAAPLACGTAAFADALDSSLSGAWTTSAPDCGKLFQRRGGALVYRQPVDKFAQAAIIGPRQIVLPSSVCMVQSVTHVSGAIKISADCRDLISYTHQTVQIKVSSPGQIVYSPTGDPALDTTLVKCRL